MSCNGKCCGLGFMNIPTAMGDDTGKYKPENGNYHNMLVRYEANGVVYLYAADGVFVKINELDQFRGLVDYVNKYFSELDVQAQIDNKLDRMVADGTMEEIIRHIIGPIIPVE